MSSVAVTVNVALRVGDPPELNELKSAKERQTNWCYGLVRRACDGRGLIDGNTASIAQIIAGVAHSARETDSATCLAVGHILALNEGEFWWIAYRLTSMRKG